MYRKILPCFLFFSCLAGVEQNRTLPAEKLVEGCSEEELMSYFPQKFVSSVLLKSGVSEEEIAKIQDELTLRDKEIIPSIEEKARKMNPNPLTDPKYREQAVKLFRETLFDNFFAVLSKYGYEDKSQVRMMLDDIQELKARQFSKCMGRFEEENQ